MKRLCFLGRAYLLAYLNLKLTSPLRKLPDFLGDLEKRSHLETLRAANVGLWAQESVMGENPIETYQQ